MREAKPLKAAAVTVAVLLLAISAAWPQAARTIRLVNPYPPGGGADVLARILADQIGHMGGPHIIVENRPGAGTVIGTEDVVRAPPDGNTLLLTNNALLLAPHMRKLNYDPLTSLDPICSVGSTPTVAVVNGASPYRTLPDLIAAAHATPGALTFGAAVGALSQVSYEMLMHRADFRMTLVPFNGTLPEVNAVFGGHIDTAFVDYPPAEGLLKSGKLRALATGARTRIAALPDVPTVAELGYPGFEIALWYGVFAPAGTPEETIADLADRFTDAAQAPQTRARLATLGIATKAVCGARFDAYLRERYDEYGRIIRDAHIKAE